MKRKYRKYTSAYMLYLTVQHRRNAWKLRDSLHQGLWHFKPIYKDIVMYLI